jgi:hypothetical protein
MIDEPDLGLKGAGVERRKIKAIDDVLEEIANCFEKRTTWGDKEAVARAEAVRLFHKHGIIKYMGPDEKPYELATIEKVKRAKKLSEEEKE